MKIARVFPTKTSMSPTDPLAFFGPPTLDAIAAAPDAVHISVTFSWDLEKADDLFYQWEMLGVPVEVGGPAFGDRMGDSFTPGLYLRDGMTITSRGCPCWNRRRKEGKAMRHCRSCKYRHMDIKALQYCNVVVDKCEMTGNLVITPFFDGFMCKFYKKRFDYPREEPQMKPDRRRALADGLFILISVAMLLAIFCAAWSCYDRLGWVRFVMRLPAPGWLKMWLWGWF